MASDWKVYALLWSSQSVIFWAPTNQKQTSVETLKSNLIKHVSRLNWSSGDNDFNHSHKKKKTLSIGPTMNEVTKKKKTSISFPCQSSADDDNNRVIFKETPCYLWALTWHQSPMSTSWGYGWHKPSNMGVIRMSEGNVSIGLILVEPMLEWTMTSHLAISRWQVQRSAPVLRQFSCFSAPVQHSPRSAHLWKYLL